MIFNLLFISKLIKLNQNSWIKWSNKFHPIFVSEFMNIIVVRKHQTINKK